MSLDYGGPAIYYVSVDNDWTYLRFLQQGKVVAVLMLSHEQAASLGRDLMKGAPRAPHKNCDGRFRS